MDQGALGSCTANAAAGIVDYCQYAAHKQFLNPSRLFTYFYTRKLEGTPARKDDGATIRGTIKSLARYGTPPEKLWPYIIAKFATTPNAAAKRPP